MALDYVGSYSAKHSADILHFGVKGMRWGVRNAKTHAFEIHQNTREDGGRDPKKGDVVRNPRSSTGKVEITALKQAKQDVFDAQGVETSKPVTVKVTVVPKKTYKDSVKDDIKGEVKDQAKDRLLGLLMSSGTDEKDYVGAYIQASDDISHFGVKGMHWGVRNERPTTGGSSGGGTETKYVAPNPNSGMKAVNAFIKHHGRPPTIGDPVAVRDTPNKQVHVFAIIKNKKTGALETKHHRTVAFDPKTGKLGKELYRKSTHDEKLKKVFRASRYIALGLIGLKLAVLATTGMYIPTPPIGNGIPTMTDPDRVLLASGVSDAKPGDYVGAFVVGGSDSLHYGVKGMRWGIRNKSGGSSSGGKASPTRARIKEDQMKADAKRVGALVEKREKVAAGQSGVIKTRDGKKLSTTEALKSIDKEIAKIAPKGKVLRDSEGKVVVRDKKVVPKEKPVPDDLATESQTAKYHRLRSQLATRGPHSLDTEDLQFINTRTAAIAQANKLLNTPDSWLQATVKSTIDSAAKQLLKNTTQALVTKHIATKLNAKLNLPPPTTPPTPTPTPPPTP